MQFNNVAEELTSNLSAARTQDTLHQCLEKASRVMGFDHFALSFDFRSFSQQSPGILVHDYPDEWAKVYIDFELAGNDPVRRACDKSVTGFEWQTLGALIPMTKGDRQMLGVGSDCGVGDGYTIPRHLPGQASGSCSFVVRPGTSLPREMFLVAEIVGAFALASAGHIAGILRPSAKPVLSDRQRTCAIWSARGKTAQEIAIILGIGAETVIQHLKIARERYDVHSRQALILCALFDGLIGFGDVIGTWNPG